MTRKDCLEFLAGFISTNEPNNQFLRNNNHLIAGDGILFDIACYHPDIVNGIMTEAYRVNTHIHSEKVSETLEELRDEWEVSR